MAMMYPEPFERGRGKKGVATTGFSRERLSHARTVLQEAPDLAPLVIAGMRQLDEAYAAAVDDATGATRARYSLTDMPAEYARRSRSSRASSRSTQLGRRDGGSLIAIIFRAINTGVNRSRVVAQQAVGQRVTPYAAMN